MLQYTFFTVCAYVFMRAFEVLCPESKEEDWYKTAIKVISCLVLYAAFASMMIFYFEGIHLLGIDPK